MKYTSGDNKRLIDFLIETQADLSREKIKKALRYGYVTCNGSVVYKATTFLKKGDVVEVIFPKKQQINYKAKSPFKIAFEDDYLIVMIKPAGILTIDYDNPDSNSFYHLAVEYIKEKTLGKQKLYIVHRLDREVSGLLVLAKSESVRQALIDNWKNSRKKYYALVEGRPEKGSGTIATWLKENEARMVYSTSQQEDAKYAITHYKVINELPYHTLIDLELETGRKNQLRVHMSDLGCPITGDSRYGSKDNYVRQIRLYSYSLAFVHPVTKEDIRVEMPLPGWFLQLKNENEDYK